MIHRLAQRAYEAYANHTGWKSLATDQPLPQWSDLPEGIQQAWMASCADLDRLRKAVVGLIGFDELDELESIEFGLRSMPVCDQDIAKNLNLIHALRDIR
jgi:hypothetical protein